MSETNETIYVSCADTAKEIRKDLRKAFPNTKFYVNSKTYSGGASIRVNYVDGPSTKRVEAMLARYVGKGPMDMTDYAPYVKFADEDGKVYSYASDYVFVERSISQEFAQHILETNELDNWANFSIGEDEAIFFVTRSLWVNGKKKDGVEVVDFDINYGKVEDPHVLDAWKQCYWDACKTTDAPGTEIKLENVGTATPMISKNSPSKTNSVNAAEDVDVSEPSEDEYILLISNRTPEGWEVVNRREFRNPAVMLASMQRMLGREITGIETAKFSAENQTHRYDWSRHKGQMPPSIGIETVYEISAEAIIEAATETVRLSELPSSSERQTPEAQVVGQYLQLRTSDDPAIQPLRISAETARAILRNLDSIREFANPRSSYTIHELEGFAEATMRAWANVASNYAGSNLLIEIANVIRAAELNDDDALFGSQLIYWADEWSDSPFPAGASYHLIIEGMAEQIAAYVRRAFREYGLIA